MAEPIEVQFLVVDSDGSKEARIRWDAHWRNLASASEPSMCGGDMAFLSIDFDHLLLLLRCLSAG